MISAIITCAGNHTRFGKNKLFESLDGKPVFIRTVNQFCQSKKVDEIIIAVRKEYEALYKRFIKKEGLKVKTVIGGEERYISAYNGVKTSRGDFVLVHDGARPLVSVALIDKIIKAVKKYRAVMAAEETYTCVKYVNNSFVEQCLPREKTWLGQTPHAFKRDIILRAYKKAIKDRKYVGMDDCELVSKLGYKVRIVKGESTNIKITFPSDLLVANCLFKLIREGENA